MKLKVIILNLKNAHPLIDVHTLIDVHKHTHTLISLKKENPAICDNMNGT